VDFDTFIDQAWTDHADRPEAVATRLSEVGLGLLQQPEQVASLAALAVHVHGQHLGLWAEGLAFQQQMLALPWVKVGSPAAQTLQRHMAVLKLAGGLASGLAGGLDNDVAEQRGAPDRSEAARLNALAAVALNAHDTQRARALLEAAIAAVEGSALADADPAVRALAVAGNNLATTLEDLPARGDSERDLMVLAAQAARTCWARAGTWLETERAEYRLAKTWLKASQPATALQHAQRCLDIVDQQPATPALALERFFGFEARACAASALQRAELLADSRARVEAAFEALPVEDQAWCQATREQVARLPG
jgi:hypothetical protein